MFRKRDMSLLSPVMRIAVSGYHFGRYTSNLSVSFLRTSVKTHPSSISLQGRVDSKSEAQPAGLITSNAFSACALPKLQRKQGLSETKPEKGYVTRWGAGYEQTKWMLRQKKAVQAYCIDHPKNCVDNEDGTCVDDHLMGKAPVSFFSRRPPTPNSLKYF